MVNRRHTLSYRPPCVLSPPLQEELRVELAAAAARHEPWPGTDVAAWMSERLGRPIAYRLGWSYLVRLKHTRQVPRPILNSKRLLKNRRPLLRQVATAFPHAQVELWATDEHRIGLKSLLRRVWAPRGQRREVRVRQRFAWRHLVGFVHPASGRTRFQLATSVSLALFAVELAAFAEAVGAGPDKQIVLVLDRAGWHTSPRLQVPEHVHLLFLPPIHPNSSPPSTSGH